MKKSILSLTVAASLLFASCGTTYKSTTDNAAYNVTVPANIKGTFATAYPDAVNVTWNRYDVATVPIDWELNGWTALDNDDYTVTFDMGSTRYTTWYDSNGAWIGTTSTLKDPQNLPSSIQSLILSKYPGYTIDKVEKEMWGSQTAYEIKLVNGDAKAKMLVDLNGNLLKEKAK